MNTANETDRHQHSAISPDGAASRNEPGTTTIRKIGDQVVHPAAAIWPEMAREDYEALVADIKANGLHEPIMMIALPDGTKQILDGCSRMRACLDLGIDPRLESYDGEDPVGFVTSRNIHRRHLDASQRAMYAAELANLRHGKHRSSEPGGITQDDAAKNARVSVRTVRMAKTVLDDGPAALVGKVKAGEISVCKAYNTVKATAPRRGPDAGSQTPHRVDALIEGEPALATPSQDRVAPSVRFDVDERLRRLVDELRQLIPSKLSQEAEGLLIDLVDVIAKVCPSIAKGAGSMRPNVADHPPPVPAITDVLVGNHSRDHHEHTYGHEAVSNHQDEDRSRQLRTDDTAENKALEAEDTNELEEENEDTSEVKPRNRNRHRDEDDVLEVDLLFDQENHEVEHEDEGEVGEDENEDLPPPGYERFLRSVKGLLPPHAQRDRRREAIASRASASSFGKRSH